MSDLQNDYANTEKKKDTRHQLRHGFATMLYEAGIDEREAMEYMGHSEITLTRMVYTHIRKSRKDETAKKLNETANKF